MSVFRLAENINMFYAFQIMKHKSIYIYILRVSVAKCLLWRFVIQWRGNKYTGLGYSEGSNCGLLRVYVCSPQHSNTTKYHCLIIKRHKHLQNITSSRGPLWQIEFSMQTIMTFVNSSSFVWCNALHLLSICVLITNAIPWMLDLGGILNLTYTYTTPFEIDIIYMIFLFN